MVVCTLKQNEIVSDSIVALDNAITHMATGDDNTEPEISDTALGNETYREAINTSITSSTQYEGQTLQDITENNGNDVDEVGLFDAASGGNIYIHSLSNNTPKDGNTEIFLRSLIDLEVQSN